MKYEIKFILDNRSHNAIVEASSKDEAIDFFLAALAFTIKECPPDKQTTIKVI